MGVMSRCCWICGSLGGVDFRALYCVEIWSLRGVLKTGCLLIWRDGCLVPRCTSDAKRGNLHIWYVSNDYLLMRLFDSFWLGLSASYSVNKILVVSTKTMHILQQEESLSMICGHLYCENVLKDSAVYIPNIEDRQNTPNQNCQLHTTSAIQP